MMDDTAASVCPCSAPFQNCLHPVTAFSPAESFCLPGMYRHPDTKIKITAEMGRVVAEVRPNMPQPEPRSGSSTRHRRPDFEREAALIELSHRRRILLGII